MWKSVCVVAALALVGCKGEDLLPTTPVQPDRPTGPQTMVIATATFEGANDYRTVGGASLESDGTEQTLLLDDDFETDRSSALDVRLCRQPGCGGDDLVLGSIQSFRGAQSYPVPGDGSDYDYVVIWCGAVELPFGTGRFR